MLRGTVREFYEFINEALDELDNFLEGQKKACWFEVKGKDYLRD